MQCEFLNVTTSDGLDLQGLVFCSSSHKENTVGVWVHGLTSSFHTNHRRLTTLAKNFNKSALAFATFDTRGHDAVSFAKKNDKRRKKGYRTITIGSAFEEFTDSVYDLDAIVDYLHEGYPKVFLIGHSTGCNKAVYYLSRPGRQRNVSGVILVAPVSDVSITKQELGENYAKALRLAKEMVRGGKKFELMPQELIKYLRTAQRFLSLADPASIEQMFPSKDFKGPLKLFQRIKVPIFVVIGENDEYLDLPVNLFVKIFKENSKSKKFKGLIIKEADHGFDGKEGELGRVIAQWMKDLG